MSDLARVIIGNVVLNGWIIRRYLKKSTYWLQYNPKEEMISLHANDTGGGEALMEIRNASHESAVKLAEELGLDDENGGPTRWFKWNPIVRLYHDGSAEAESLRMEMLKLNLPFRLFKGTSEWEFTDGQFRYSASNNKVDEVLDLIRKDAERYKKQLNSTP